MTLIMVIILLLGYLLIATENVTKINKVAVAVFMGTLCWVLWNRLCNESAPNGLL